MWYLSKVLREVYINESVTSAHSGRINYCAETFVINTEFGKFTL
jgi:hypothetical protein